MLHVTVEGDRFAYVHLLGVEAPSLKIVNMDFGRASGKRQNKSFKGSLYRLEG